MAERLQAIRGMNDILPEDTKEWQYLEYTLANLMSSYGYEEIRFPIVEQTTLFKRSIGEVTDIVEKEMYTFTDLNGDSLTLRPEGTAGCVRACIEHGLTYNQQQRLWYLGPMFRHEKPQKGRYRQFFQFGVEAFGFSGPIIELELIAMSAKLWVELGMEQHVSLEVNSLGSMEDRLKYKETLVEYLKSNIDALDDDSKRRLNTNPMRILDSKNPELQALINKAPKLSDVLCEESRMHFTQLCEGLEALGIDYIINPCLVRGLDYYSHSVFEWVTDKLGSQATICAGGRYDSLVEQLGGKPCPAVGFAMGMERILLLLSTINLNHSEPTKPLCYIITEGSEAMIAGLNLAEKLRQEFPRETVLVNATPSSYKSQFKKADKSNAQFAIIIGGSEMENNTIAIKNLQQKEEQQMIPQEDFKTLTKIMTV